MTRLLGCLFIGLMLSITGPAIGQEAKKPKGPVAQKQSQELIEALQRIDRLEAQIVEMQSVIGALQTLVKKGSVQPAVGVKKSYQFEAERQPLNQRRLEEQPEFQTDGWGADTQSSINEVPPTEVPGADLALNATPPKSRVTLNGKSPQSLYDAGYNYMLSSDYTSAEATFRAFLSNYPNNNLSGNAQYWLGEVYFVRGNYRQAANEFLKGYQTYRKSPKAPDNLLKLGMSLHRLGQNEAACQTFSELKSKYKSLPGHIDRKVGAEIGKAGC